mgnify:FL=1
MAEALDNIRHRDHKYFLETSHIILELFKHNIKISDVLSEICRHDVIFPLVFMIHKLIEYMDVKEIINCPLSKLRSRVMEINAKYPKFCPILDEMFDLSLIHI